MTEQWLGTSGEEVGLVLVSAVAVLLWAIVVIRVNGPRSLSKMSSVDFVVTVAMGSLIASASQPPPLRSSMAPWPWRR